MEENVESASRVGVILAQNGDGEVPGFKKVFRAAESVYQEAVSGFRREVPKVGSLVDELVSSEAAALSARAQPVDDAVVGDKAGRKACLFHQVDDAGGAVVPVETAKRVDHLRVGKLSADATVRRRMLRELEDLLEEASMAESVDEVRKGGIFYGRIVLRRHYRPELVYHYFPLVDGFRVPEEAPEEHAVGERIGGDSSLAHCIEQIPRDV